MIDLQPCGEDPRREQVFEGRAFDSPLNDRLVLGKIRQRDDQIIIELFVL